MLKRTKLRLRETILIIICLGLCGYFLNLFWKDLNTSTTRKDKDQIGSIYFKYKVAQRKFSDRVVWERVQQNSPLYNEDTIRTADAALASISFIDGTKIELNENTMLQIFYNEKGVQISVGGGDIDVDTTAAKTSVSVTMQNGSTLSLDSGSVLSASSNVAGDNSFSVKTGTANVKNKEGVSQTISTGESVKVEATGHITKNPVTVTSISSDTKILAYENDNKAVELKWNGNDSIANEKVIVQTSYSKDFENVLESYKAKSSDVVDLPVDKGTLYWRVFPEDSLENAVEGKITLFNMQEIKVSSPLKGASFSYRKGSPLPMVNFKWTGDPYVSYYKFELSVLPNFDEVISSTECRDTSYSMNSLDAGIYYWRVTPYYVINDTGYAKASEIMKFAIVQEEKLLPPSLSLPLNSNTITLSEKPSNIQFAWKSSIKGAEYKLEIADTKKFENVIYSMSTNEKRFTEEFDINKLPEGEYYWKVTRVSEEDYEPAVSKIRNFTVKQYIPGENKLIYPPENYSVELSRIQNVSFTWKLAEDFETQTSTFQISDSSDFTNIIAEQNEEKLHAENLKIKGGTYYWRVGTENLSGEMAFTQPRKLTVVQPLQSPAITEPTEQQNFLLPKGSNVQLKWNPVPNADYYKIKLYDTKDNSVLQEVSNITSPEILLTQVNIGSETQKYKCSVQAFVEETPVNQAQSSGISWVSFDVREPKHVALVYPLDGTKIDGLSAIRTPVDFEWKKGDEPVKSVFELRKVNANGSTRVVQRIENPDESLKLPRLTEGRYRWTVKASGENGLVLDAENSGNFTVTAIPDLNRAKLVNPEQNFIIGPVFLRKNRNIGFSWRAVEGANQYKFTLYQKLSNGKLKKIVEENTGKSTDFKLKDLSKLDVGQFQWTVTAYCYAKDGYLEQKSKASIGEFAISFDLPSTVETIDPGRMYGN